MGYRKRLRGGPTTSPPVLEGMHRPSRKRRGLVDRSGETGDDAGRRPAVRGVLSGMNRGSHRSPLLRAGEIVQSGPYRLGISAYRYCQDDRGGGVYIGSFQGGAVSEGKVLHYPHPVSSGPHGERGGEGKGKFSIQEKEEGKGSSKKDQGHAQDQG